MYLHNIPKDLVNSFLNLAYTIMSTDKKITDDEMQVFNLYKIELNLEELPECMKVDFETELNKFKDLPKVIKKEVFFELLSLALADSNYDDSEKKLIDMAAKKLSVTKNEAQKIENITFKIMDIYKELGMIICE